MTAGTVPLLASVQRFLGRQHGLYINGGWRPSTSSQTLTVFNPANGQPIAVTPDASAEDVDQAVQSAHRAFVSGVWARRAPAEAEAAPLRAVRGLASVRRPMHCRPMARSHPGRRASN